MNMNMNIYSIHKGFYCTLESMDNQVAKIKQANSQGKPTSVES